MERASVIAWVYDRIDMQSTHIRSLDSSALPSSLESVLGASFDFSFLVFFFPSAAVIHHLLFPVSLTKVRKPIVDLLEGETRFLSKFVLLRN